MYLSGQGKVGRGRGGGKKLTGRRKDKRKLAGTLEARHRGLPPPRKKASASAKTAGACSVKSCKCRL